MKICQSCMQPMHFETDFGTNADGSRSEDYCTLCWSDGAFTNPDATMQDVINYRAPSMVNMIIDPEQGRKLVTEWISALKRWK